MSAPAPVEVPEPIYTFYAPQREKCHGGCGIQIQPGDLVTRRGDEFRCNTCAERWNK
jgi:hypothetical protein